MSRRAIRVLIPVLLLSLIRSGAAFAAPDLLLITIDTLRADHLQTYGYPRATAPFLDSLATESTVYLNASSTSSWTVPAVASMVTGVYPTSHGVLHGGVTKGVLSGQEALPESLPTLAAVLRARGYRTFGVAANMHLDAELGFSEGFDRYECLGFAPAERVNDTVLEWRDEITSGDGPVFLWLHYFDPHFRYTPREEWLGDFLPDLTDAELAEMRRAQADWTSLGRYVETDDRRADVLRALYDSEIRHADEHIRSLYASMPFLDSCWTLVTSDHGEEFREHGELGHSRNLYNETVRIPFFIRPPNGGANTIVADPVSIVDVPPTLLVAAGGEPPHRWNGVALQKSSPDDRLASREFVLAELDRFPTNAGLKALVGRGWKYIARPGHPEVELYDLQGDPGERVNLARREHARVGGLTWKLEAMIKSLPVATPSPVRRKLTEEEKERLRRLGYLN